MNIDKKDIEACARIFCDMMKINPDAPHPHSDPENPTLNWQVSAERFREMLTMNEAMRQHLANRESDLQDKIQDIGKAVSPASN